MVQTAFADFAGFPSRLEVMMTDQHVPPATDPATPAPAEGTRTASAPAGEPETTSRRLSTLKRFIVPVVIGLALLGFKIWNSQTAADSLKVGQCAAKEGEDGIKGLDCSDAAAKFKILHIEQSTSQSSADKICAQFPETAAAYFEGREDGSKGDLICLGSNT